MSEKDTKMLSTHGDNIGEKILSILNRVTYPMTKDSDCKSMEKSASSPDSAIDLTEDNKHLCDISSSHDFVHDILDAVIDDVLDEIKRRERKKKREKFSDSEKWNLLKQESTIGWKRILSRNSDDEGGWGFNFISPKGLKLTIKELEKFLKKKKLDIDDLVFEAHKIELHSYPRKKAKLKMGYPLDKIRDLKLPKKLEWERKRKLAQMRAASQPTFKSISEFLASLDQSDCQSYVSDDASRDFETDDDTEDSDRSKDSSFNISVESVSEEYGHCSQLVEEIIHNVVLLSSRSPVSLISPNTRIKSLEKNMAEVQLTLSSMLQNSSSPKTVEKLKIKFTDRVSSKAQTPEKTLTEIDRLMATRVSVEENCDSADNTPKIEKLKITPERLKEKRSSLSQDYVSEMNTPTSLKIRKPSGSPERTNTKTKPTKAQSSTQKTSAKKKLLAGTKSPKTTESCKQGKAKKFSIFKTRNKEKRDENAVNFTDKTVGKKLNIRRSSKEMESKGAQDGMTVAKNCTDALKIEIDSDADDVSDEFTQASAKPLQSPHSKMTVVQHPVGTETTPVRRNIFGPHSPACKDEISPEKLESQKKISQDCDKVARPASRTKSRVLSNEDAMKAIDAVVNLSDLKDSDSNIFKKSHLKSGPSDIMSPSLPDRSKQSTPSLPGATPTPTPSLPLLSPHDFPDDSHSNMTTPSLPSLSPAIRNGTSQASQGPVSNSPTLPNLSPALPKRPEGILPRRQPPIMQLDPSKSLPLSVEIPPNHINSFNSSQSGKGQVTSTAPPNNSVNKTTVAHVTPKISRKSKIKIQESPIERSATGRRMRDCRKFIHYEFSPPFASSESSVSELESPENRKESLMKKLQKKKGRTQSMTEECLSSPSSLSSNSSVPNKKRGRPVKSKSTDFREEIIVLDDESNSSPVVFEEKKRKRGRPAKKKNIQAENGKISVSDLAENLSENQISPITREKLVFPLSSPNTEEIKAKLISQQRESFMMRRNSEDTRKSRKSKKVSRSKSADVPQNEGVSKKESLEELQESTCKEPEPEFANANESSHVLVNNEKKDSLPGTSQVDKHSATLIVRKSVKVQDYADPLMTIRDQLPKTSPPPQLINESERPVTPPPGPCTIYQENLDLVDGLRVLTKIGPHFYPGSVKTIDSPSIFAVTVDGERGNKPHIYSAEDLLAKTILEVKPKSCRYTPVGTRVCVFWSSKLNFLYPGTVQKVHTVTQYITVTLDDGDERDINICNVRLLPKGYPKVNCKDKESPIGVVEANTISPVSVNAIQFVRSPTEKKTKENEYDEENALLKLKSSGLNRKLSSQRLFHNQEDNKAMSTEISKQNAKAPNHDIKDPTLKDEYLRDGMRILTINEGHFYPGRLNATRPPDIYGVLFDNERGFRPKIYAREQLLKDSVRELKLKSSNIPVGTRVCVYWSSKYQYLHPATVIANSEMNGRVHERYLNVILDDGDTREINIDQIRYLPPNFPKVVYNEDNPSPRKKSSSRPSSRADTPKSGCVSDNSRPSSSLSNFSDTPNSDRDSSVKSPLSPLKIPNGTTPPISRDSTPLTSPVSNKVHQKVFIPEPPPKPQTFDLVGMISSGIDKLVDKKKVVGSRPPGFAPAHPHHNMQPRPPMAAHPPHMPSPHYMMSPNPYTGFPPTPNYSHPPPSPHPSMSPSPPPPPPPQQSPSKIVSPPLHENNESSKCNGDSKISDSENKAKSRLSNLIQAMSGKIKAPETPASPADQILNKWQLAFNVKPPTPTKSPTKDLVKGGNEKEEKAKETKNSNLANDHSGYLEPINIVSGTKILLMKNNIFYAASLVCVAPNKVCGIKFKNNTFSDVQYYSEQDLMKISVLEREIVNGMSLQNNQRVAITSKSNTDTFVNGSVVDFRNGVYVIQMDKGGFEEANSENLRILPNDYPKNNVSPKKTQVNKEEKPSVQSEQTSKYKHKHNILLGYDFVDENDTDIVAWDRAIQRRRKLDKSKSVSPPLAEMDIKQEEDADEKPESEQMEETKDSINAEVNQSVQSMLDQVTLEDRMRISLLSNMLKKHSPKKEVNTKAPGNKSPKQSNEVVKKEKKRKGSKDSISKRLSMEDEDLSSELISICKESNIDISKQNAKEATEEKDHVQLENKIEEIVDKSPEDESDLQQGESDQLTIDEKQDHEVSEEEKSDNSKASMKKKLLKKDKAKADEMECVKAVSSGFSYIDPKMPPNWSVTVKKRADGVHHDTYYFTPCNTKLRSVLEIRKFLCGEINSKPLRKARDIANLPKRFELSESDLAKTKEIDDDLFTLPKSENVEMKTTDKVSEEMKLEDEDIGHDHVFKVPSLESFRSQKIKSSKLLSPSSSSEDLVESVNSENRDAETPTEEESEKPEKIVEDCDSESEITPSETKEDITERKLLRSQKSKSRDASCDDDSESLSSSANEDNTTESKTLKRKTRSQGSNSGSESENEDDKKSVSSLSETSGSETEGEGTNLKRRKKRSLKRVKGESEDVKEENGSDKENDNLTSIIKDIESDQGQVNGKHPKKLTNVREEKKRRSLRSSACEEKKSDTILKSPEVREENSANTELDGETETEKEKNTKKRKALEGDEIDDRESKKIALLKPSDDKPVVNESVPEKNSLPKKQQAGTKSQRTSSNSSDENLEDLKTKKKMLGPKSKRKSTGDEPEEIIENEDITDDVEKLSVYNQKLTDATANFYKKKKHPKCNVKMLGLFQESLCRAECGHCKETGHYTATAHLLHFDMPHNVVSMECVSCRWTTVRKMTITTKVLE